MTRQISRTLAVVSILFLAPVTAQAALQRVGPVDPANGYPVWYQDGSGLTMQFCSPANAVELNGGWCLMLPPIPPATLPVAPETFPNQFFNEHFYWAANGTLPTGATRAAATALLTVSLEGAFRSGPVIPGDQITFGRIRVVIPNIPVSGDYTIYHPFGVWVFPGLVAGQKLFWTEDVGFNCAAGVFDCALATPIGPYLLPSATQGGLELPPIPVLAFNSGVDPFFATAAPLPPGVPQPFAAGAPTAYPGNVATAAPKYIADPARLGPVTGSPLAPFVSAVDGLPHNHNTFRIEVLAAGTTVPVLLDESPYFTLQGKIFEGAIPGTVSVNRASYTVPVWASSTAAKVDVYATGIPAAQARVPAAPLPLPGAAPALVFWDAPCTLDPVTLAPIGPPATGVSHQMFASGSNYWGQSPPPTVPLGVCVAQTNAAGGAVYYAKAIEDEVDVASSLYDPATTSLTVNATSSDLLTIPAPTLTLFDFGVLTAGTITTTLKPAPATVRVSSTAGGVTDFQTATAAGVAPTPTVPVAVNDMVTMFEDCSALPATVCAVPQIIAPLANDTLAGAPIVFGPNVTINLASAPRLGSAVVNLDGTISYTPASNANGTDGFSYTVTVTDPVTLVATTSNIAGISVVITPVNDPPVAVNDTFSTVIGAGGVATGVINVLANDTDPDGFVDIVGVSNLTQPVGPLGAITSTALDATGRNVVFSTNTAGTYTFTYQARDTAGVLSNVGTVTVTVSGAEVITITPPALYRITQLRWTVAGTDSPAAGQVLTITYLDGPNAGFQIGTATVTATGAYLLDIKGVTGLFNPTTAGATQVKVTGPSGAFATAPISVK
jgi:hypothetical protein